MTDVGNWENQFHSKRKSAGRRFLPGLSRRLCKNDRQKKKKKKERKKPDLKSLKTFPSFALAR